jgi:hypothetical protein
MTPAEVWGFCERLADTPLLPDAYRRNASSILWALEYGRALNLDVVTTITTIHVIKGKPSQSADLMLSRTRAAGHRVRVQPGDGSCTVSIWRSDDPEFENRVTWTYDDAVTANLCEMRNNRPYSRSQKGEPQAWEKYPRAMLRARAISECVRQACPEVLHGAIYTPEELGAVIDQDGNPLDVQPQLQRQAPGQDAWETATPAPVQHATPPPQKGGEQAEREWAQRVGVTPPHEQQTAAAEPEQPPQDGNLSPEARQYLADARATETRADFAWVRKAAEDAGAPAGFLAWLDRIAAKKWPAEQPQDAPQAPSYDAVTATLDAVHAQGGPQEPAAEPVAATLPGAPASGADRLGAVAQLYAAAHAAGMSEVEARQVLAQETGGKTTATATGDEIAAVTAALREAAGGAR